MADANRLQQVFANMLSNAAKFSPPNETVEISFFAINQFIRIAVKDCGAGIPEEFQGRIFEAFAQANNTNTRQHGGTGLGLHIRKKLMHEMKGDKGYLTSIGEGTTFWITIPVAVSANLKKSE